MVSRALSPSEYSSIGMENHFLGFFHSVCKSGMLLFACISLWCLIGVTAFRSRGEGVRVPSNGKLWSPEPTGDSLEDVEELEVFPVCDMRKGGHLQMRAFPSETNFQVIRWKMRRNSKASRLG